MICEYCSNTFRNKSSLNYHQKTAKYCLEKRGQNNTGFLCTFCKKNFTEKKYFKNHTEKCSSKYHKQKNLEILDRIIESKDKIIQEQYNEIKTLQNKMLQEQTKQISVLQDKIENIAIKAATKSTSTKKTTNIIQLPLTQEWLNENAKYLTEQHVKDGIPGLARYAVEFPLKNRIIVADASRRTIKFKNEEGNMMKDIKGVQTTKMVCKSIKDPVIENITKIRNEKIDFLAALDEPDITITDTTMKELDILSNIQIGINKISAGKEDELQTKFIDNVCTLVAT